MENFHFEDGCEEVKHNPWSVESIEEFRFYCCPECDIKEMNKRDFLRHAAAAHPRSQSLFDSLEVESRDSNAASETSATSNPVKNAPTAMISSQPQVNQDTIMPTPLTFVTSGPNQMVFQTPHQMVQVVHSGIQN